MKKSRLLVLALAVVAAGGAFVLANAPKPPPVEVAAPVATQPSDDVLVAAKDIPLGTVVGDGDMSWQAWPKTGVAAGMIIKGGDQKVLDDLKGSIARASFFTGEPIRREKLIKGAGFMSAILPPGKRAVAINIDSQGATTAGGFILPNDRVDVVRTIPDADKNSSGFLTETLLQNVKVLAIGQNVQDKNGTPVVVGSNATLELDPVQAETIILAQRVGQLSLTLRSLQDANQAESPAVVKPDNSLTVVRYGTAASGGNDAGGTR